MPHAIDGSVRRRTAPTHTTPPPPPKHTHCNALTEGCSPSKEHSPTQQQCKPGNRRPGLLSTVCVNMLFRAQVAFTRVCRVVAVSGGYSGAVAAPGRVHVARGAAPRPWAVVGAAGCSHTPKLNKSQEVKDEENAVEGCGSALKYKPHPDDFLPRTPDLSPNGLLRFLDLAGTAGQSPVCVVGCLRCCPHTSVPRGLLGVFS